MASITSIPLRHGGLSCRALYIVPAAHISTPSKEASPTFYNRNPRNLERLRIAYKPYGYNLDVKGREFWHKLVLKRNGRCVAAAVLHNSGVEVLTASTREWAIKKFLYRTSDTSAYINLARVFAQRCLECGITEISCDLKPHPGGKVETFMNVLQDGGVTLSEPSRFKPHRPWDMDRPEKPWEVIV